ncbi:MAG: glucosaminidase domain-containing protein [Eubacteriales bacterium]|nr:glucosaminidase domain-containing protein [Eubacteriales bacterium]
MNTVTKCKKMIIFLLAFVMICSSVGTSAATIYKRGKKTYRYTGAPCKVYVDNKKVSSLKKYGIVINNNLMIPYKQCLVKKGPEMEYSYDKASKTLTLVYNGTTVRMTANKKYIYVNEEKKKLRTAPTIVNFSGKNVYMIPAKAVLKNAFGFGYEYKNKKKKKTLYLTTPETTTDAGVVQSDEPPMMQVSTNTLTAAAFANMTTTQFIEAMGPIAQEDYKNSGVLASVTLAQAILESGWGKSTLCQAGNNVFGMKTNLSGNTWLGSSWDGVSMVTLRTGEEYNGRRVTVTASFRKYETVAQSVADHSAYLVNAKNGYANRYQGLTDTTSYVEQVNIIKNGGYATSSNYVSQLISLIERYNLTQYDQ